MKTMMKETEFDKKLYDELYPDLTYDELTDEFITMNYRDLCLESLEYI